MASSSYRFFLKNSTGRSLSTKFITDADWENISKNNVIVSSSDSTSNNIYKVAKGWVPLDQQRYFTDSHEHSCRETLLNGMSRISRELKEYNNNPSNFQGHLVLTSVVVYTRENGYSLTEERISKIMEFYKRLGTANFFSIYTKKLNERDVIVIAYEYSPGISYFISYLLWIFRKLSILDWILENFPTKISLYELTKALTVKFLENPLWGDGYNGNMWLSMFSYLYTRNCVNSSMSDRNNGPVNYVRCSVGFSLTIDYIRSVLVPMYKKSPEQVIKIISGNVDYGSSLFSDYIDTINGIISAKSQDISQDIPVIDDEEDYDDDYDDEED